MPLREPLPENLGNRPNPRGTPLRERLGEPARIPEFGNYLGGSRSIGESGRIPGIGITGYIALHSLTGSGGAVMEVLSRRYRTRLDWSNTNGIRGDTLGKREENLNEKVSS